MSTATQHSRPDDLSAWRIRIPATLAVGALLFGLSPFSRAQSAVEPRDVPDYSTSSHHDLTGLGARWDELSDLERGALLREVKLRMARQKQPDGVLVIRTQRRYGRIYRHSDGRVLRIETQVVRVQPIGPRTDNSGFGVGYERRSAEVLEAETEATEPNLPPGTLVNDSLRR